MRVIIAAAGTGGHINPAIAIANKIKKEKPNSEIVFFGTHTGLENDLVPRAGYKLVRIEAYGFRKEVSVKNLKQITKTFNSIRIVKKFIDEFKPDIVIGTGGYICVPVFYAANAKKIPTILHESNAFPGKAVRMFAKKADKVLVGFDNAKTMFSYTENIVTTGNPTKIKKVKFSNKEKEEIIKKLGLKSELPVVLVTGGSQGAKKINEAVTDIILEGLNKNYQFVWATGKKQYDNVKNQLKGSNLDIDNIKNTKILPYIYNMEEMLNIMDLEICRSGAMTITELANVGKPAIFIPLPSVVANKQVYNAKVLEKLGAAKVILNSELTYQNLNSTIEEMISDRENLKQMGKNAMKIEVKNVEDKIYKEIKNIVKNRAAKL